MVLQDNTTVREEAQKAFADVQKVKDRIDHMEQLLNSRTDYESADYMALVEKYTSEHERYLMMGAESYEAQIERTLTGLGLNVLTSSALLANSLEDGECESSWLRSY